MTEALEELAGAFHERDRRPAVFDREIRERVGQWSLPESIPVEEIVDQFRDHPSFDDTDVGVLIPVHEPDSAELTGEYLLYRPAERCVFYHEFATDRLEGVRLDALSESYPAWQLRYWHPEYAPPKPPTYRTNGAATGAEATENAMAGTAMAGDTTAESGSTGGTEGPRRVTARETAGEGDDPVEALRSLIAEEKLAERDRARHRWTHLPRSEYIETRGGIPTLAPAGVETDAYGQQLVRLHRTEDNRAGAGNEAGDHGGDTSEAIGNGVEVLIDSLGSDDGFPVEATVVDVEDDELALSIYWDRGPNNPSLSAFEAESDVGFALGTLVDPKPYERRQEALEVLAADERRRGWLTGTASVEFEESDGVDALSSARLNQSQYAAARSALRSTDVFCIRGPPGTGTTRTLVEIIRAAATAGERVLAVSHSPSAIDRLLVGDGTADRTDPDSLHHVISTTDLTASRLGTETASQIVADQYVGNDRYQSDVVCSTVAATETFGPDVFDLVVVAEATRATLSETLVPISRGKRTILVGDPMQLPPGLFGEFPDDVDSHPTLFERLTRLYGSDIVETLRIQYRMNEAIAAFPNEAFYSGVLEHGQRNRDWTIPSLPPLTGIHVTGEERQSPSNSFYNEGEIAVVCDEVRRLLEAGVTPDEIGVVTPFSAQIGKIRVAIDSLPGDDTEQIHVGRSDSLHGGSKEAIIISFVRSNPHGFTGVLTHPEAGPRRLNVAMTRAQRRCVLVGNFETLRTRAPTNDSEECSTRVYQRLYEHLQETDVLSNGE